ncbi:MAG: DUF4872 domain-containing protein [Deltaproteobacteria bacterium]|nr:DUF4872 domain-containing protein [Deltaproteobacteria bacterium]
MMDSDAVRTIEGYTHEVASHCETGSVRNLLRHAGVDVSEPMVFGVGSGPAFYYLFFVKGPSGMPLVALRNKPGHIFRQVGRLCGIDFFRRRLRTTREAMARADALIDAGIPPAACVDMFRMKYLPPHLRVHAPMHFVALVGRDEHGYAVSDPYHPALARLGREDLEAAWATGAPMAQDNLLVYVRRVPPRIDWPRAAARAMRRTSRAMLLPPVPSRIVWFAGIAGIRTYARALRSWLSRYRGVPLREGMLFNAVGFEDQGTGGGAFRLMYGAFLQEVAAQRGSEELAALARRMVEHGREWRRASRQLVVLARAIPMVEDEYDDWLRESRQPLEDGLAELSGRFMAFAEIERALWRDLGALAAKLG